MEVLFVIHKDPLLDHTDVYANEVTKGSPLASRQRLATPERPGTWLEGWNF